MPREWLPRWTPEPITAEDVHLVRDYMGGGIMEVRVGLVLRQESCKAQLVVRTLNELVDRANEAWEKELLGR